MDHYEAVFKPNHPVNAEEWYQDADRQITAFETRKRQPEKTNRDMPFRYPVATVTDQTEERETALTSKDWAAGIRPEFIKICEDGPLEGEVFSAMPAGMETTVRIKVGNYLLTGVVFGGITYRLGEKIRLDFTGDSVCLFSRRNGRLAETGKLCFVQSQI